MKPYLQSDSRLYSLSDGIISRVWADSHIHHKFPRGENNFRALRAGPQDLPEPQSEVCGEEHRPGLWVREGAGGAVQTSGRASFTTGGVHWWTLPRGQLLLLNDVCTGSPLILVHGVKFILQGAEKILGMNESGELQDLLTKIEVSFFTVVTLEIAQQILHGLLIYPENKSLKWT